MVNPMPPMPDGYQSQPFPTLGIPGAWTHDGPTWEEGWHWETNGTPDPELVQAWGADAIGDIHQNPIGEPNHGVGSWWYSHGGGLNFDYGWAWRWGTGPEQVELDNGWSPETLTDPTKPPGEESGPPPNVTPPVLTDGWGGHVPDATGGTPPGESGETLSEPPTVNRFVASPGGIRYAEVVIYGDVQKSSEYYERLRGVVTDSASWDIYFHNENIELGSAGRTNYDLLVNAQNQLLLQVADSIKLTSDFIDMLNAAVQNYTRADIDSFPPTE